MILISVKVFEKDSRFYFKHLESEPKEELYEVAVKEIFISFLLITMKFMKIKSSIEIIWHIIFKKLCLMFENSWNLQGTNFIKLSKSLNEKIEYCG